MTAVTGPLATVARVTGAFAAVARSSRTLAARTGSSAVGTVTAVRLTARSVLTVAALARMITRTRVPAGVSIALMPAGPLVAARPMVVLALVMCGGVIARVLVSGGGAGRARPAAG